MTHVLRKYSYCTTVQVLHKSLEQKKSLLPPCDRLELQPLVIFEFHSPYEQVLLGNVVSCFWGNYRQAGQPNKKMTLRFIAIDMGRVHIELN